MNMPRFTPYLGIAAALAVGAFIVAFSGGVTVLYTHPAITSTSSTAFVVPNITLPTITPPPAPVSAPVAKVPATSASPVSPSTLIYSSPSANDLLDASASALRSALVNIICYVPAWSGLHSMSGSGVIIDPKGIILTNAHIAQYFLLADRGVSCTIRSGSPAVNRYEANLVYISPAWLRANANVLTQTNPSGTGEYDFAFLAITKSKTPEALPSSFPFVPLATVPPASGTPVVIASYGAQFLESSQIQSSLFPTIVFGSVKDVFTFVSTTIDILALGGSAAAQEGSSGGGIAGIYGELVGTITTSTTQGTTDTRSLGAITASYIRAAYANETGQAIDILLSKPLMDSINNFAPQIPVLESILTAHLP